MRTLLALVFGFVTVMVVAGVGSAHGVQSRGDFFILVGIYATGCVLAIGFSNLISCAEAEAPWPPVLARTKKFLYGVGWSIVGCAALWGAQWFDYLVHEATTPVTIIGLAFMLVGVVFGNIVSWVAVTLDDDDL